MSLPIEYRNHPYTSNSDLNRLKAQLSGRDQYESEDAFAMGTLIDAMLTQPERVDFFNLRVHGEDYVYTAQQFDQARKMKVSALNDSEVRMYVSRSEFQVAFYTPGMEFSKRVGSVDIPLWLDGKCLYDFIFRPAGLGGDIKSTIATTQEQFENVVDRFDYDQSRVFYMKQSGLKRDVVIGISKKPPYRLFKVRITEGDDIWNRGLEKLNDIVYKKKFIGE